jgi:hypothetical protein
MRSFDGYFAVVPVLYPKSGMVEFNFKNMIRTVVIFFMALLLVNNSYAQNSKYKNVTVSNAGMSSSLVIMMQRAMWLLVKGS